MLLHAKQSNKYSRPSLQQVEPTVIANGIPSGDQVVIDLPITVPMAAGNYWRCNSQTQQRWGSGFYFLNGAHITGDVHVHLPGDML